MRIAINPYPHWRFLWHGIALLHLIHVVCIQVGCTNLNAQELLCQNSQRSLCQCSTYQLFGSRQKGHWWRLILARDFFSTSIPLHHLLPQSSCLLLRSHFYPKSSCYYIPLKLHSVARTVATWLEQPHSLYSHVTANGPVELFFVNLFGPLSLK